jgi:methionine aminopeptidase
VTVVSQVFTIEPIVVAAPDYELFQLDDKWTIGIVSEAKCAMFEHSVMVHESGCHVLTAGGGGEGGE